PVLRPAPGELVREARLLDLAAEAPRGVLEVDVADELLRDRGAALDDATGTEVRERRAGDRPVVDAAVPVEAAILDRDRGLPEPARDPPERHRPALDGGRHLAERRAVGGVEEGVGAERQRPRGVERAVREQDLPGDPGSGHEEDEDESDR